MPKFGADTPRDVRNRRLGDLQRWSPRRAAALGSTLPPIHPPRPPTSASASASGINPFSSESQRARLGVEGRSRDADGEGHQAHTLGSAASCPRNNSNRASNAAAERSHALPAGHAPSPLGIPGRSYFKGVYKRPAAHRLVDKALLAVEQERLGR